MQKIQGTTLSTRSDEYKADLIRDFDLVSRDHFESRKLKPILDRTFKFSDIVRGKVYSISIKACLTITFKYFFMVLWFSLLFKFEFENSINVI